MSNTETTNNTPNSVETSNNTIVVEAIKSPLAFLNEEQRGAVLDKFNKSWQKSRRAAIEAVQTATGFSLQESCFTVYLLELADTTLSNNRIASVADTMLSVAKDVLKGNEDVKANAFRTLVAAYERLGQFEAPQAGKRFLDLLFRSKEILRKDAVRIQELVLEHLEIEESEWR